MRLKSLFIALLLLAAGVVSLSFADTYPQFNISGYKKWEFYKINVDPPSNILLAQTYLGGLSSSLGLTGPWQERLKLGINSKLNDSLTVSYDIEQEPESPQVSNVKVKYDNTELTFGDFTANIAGNEFASTTRFLNGVMLTSKDENYDFTLIPSAKSKSNNQALSTAYGNNTRGPYSLGHGSIVEGSEQIVLNNIKLTRGIDYTIDYFEGNITFPRILVPTDAFTYTYEYTNLIDLFFPTVSKMDFFAIQARGKVSKYFLERGPKSLPPTVTGEATEIFPSTPLSLPKKGLSVSTKDAPDSTQETKSAPASEEGLGLYKLKHFPVVEFSERIIFGGRVLKKLEDYSVNYDNGTIVLFADQLPDKEDPMSVSYSYCLVSNEAENLSGRDSRGPYQLSYLRVVKNSENIIVDGKKFFKDIDYTIDYPYGKITFNAKVSPSSNISASYQFAQNTQKVESEAPNYLTVGATYMKESATAGSTTPTNTVIETKLGSDVINDILSLKNLPLDSSQPISVSVNGVPYTDFYVPTADATSFQLPYVNDKNDASDGYATGALKFNTALSATDEISVTYSYKSSIIGTFTGNGNGGTGPYYLTTATNIVPGSDRLQAWASGSSVVNTYTRNSSKGSFSGQYSFNYNFPYTPYITFNDPFPSNSSFTVTFYSVPASSTNTDKTINHDVIGIDTEGKIGDIFHVSGAYGRSRTDQVIASEGASDTIAGNNTRGPYSLSHVNIIENSEKIYVDGWLRNKDIDYFINYANGQITFYYVSINSNSKITANYNYQSLTGALASTDLVSGNAYKAEASTKIGSFEMGGSYREMEPEFAPMGSTTIGTGSQRKELSTKFWLGKYVNINSSLVESKSQIGTYKGFFDWNTDRNIGITATPQDLFTANLNYRNTKSLDDLVPGTAVHSDDSVGNAVSGSLVLKDIRFKALTFKNRQDFTNTEATNNLNNSKSTVSFFHTGNTLNILNKANFGLDYQYSEPVTGTPEAETFHEISKDMTYDFDWDLTLNPIKRLATRVKVVDHDQKDLITGIPNKTKNESYNITFDPISTISTSYDKSRQETQSVQQSQPNPRTERSNINVRFTPISILALSYGKTDDDSLQETGASSNGSQIDIGADISPFTFLRFGSRWSTQDRFSNSFSGTTEIATTLNSESRDFTLSVIPFFFPTLNSEMIIEDYNNNDSTGAVSTKTQNVTTKYWTSFNPLSFITFSITYTEKITKDLILSVEKPKTTIDTATNIRLSDWATLAHTWEQERNLGEVQAGIMTNYDILRITNEYSLNINLPQSNVVLSSITIKASWKDVLYSDLLNPVNNFNANLASLEGSLNF